MLGSTALFELLRLKLRGTLRRHVRRMRTLKGAAQTIFGLLIFVGWFSFVLFTAEFSDAPRGDSGELMVRVALAGLFLTCLSASNALSHRGLFLPREEIERLFSAPVRRSDLVRYRLWTNTGRSLIGGILLGLLAMGRMPRPGLAFCGVLLGMQTLPVFHQLIAILLGGLEKRFAKRLKALGNVLFYGALLGILALSYFLVVRMERPRFLENIREGDPLAQLAGWLDSPVVFWAGLPFQPWARAITAVDLSTFGFWASICVAIWWALFELTARLSIDFRELSLETAASVAARLRRVRRGGGAAAGKVSRRVAGWPVPWLFGRGPAGALAWRKTASMLRKAKGTLWISALILAFVTVMSALLPDSEEQSYWGPVLIAILGTFYLCAGLRFDFRDEFERMHVIKAWPLRPGLVFFATLLPEVCLVSTLLSAAVLARAWMAGSFHPVVVGVLVLLPMLVFGWVALDNAVFLFAPVRFVPGQEGALQNAGRSVLVTLLRVLLLAVGGALAGLAGFGCHWGLARSGAPRELVLSGTIFAAWSVALIFDAALIAVGAMLFRRFDVATDRG